MSERIVEVYPEKYAEKFPEIIRCRDCKFFVTGKNWDHCAFTEKYARAEGFCAWGERRVNE